LLWIKREEIVFSCPQHLQVIVLPFGMGRRAIWYKSTDVSELCATSNIGRTWLHIVIFHKVFLLLSTRKIAFEVILNKSYRVYGVIYRYNRTLTLW